MHNVYPAARRHSPATKTVSGISRAILTILLASLIGVLSSTIDFSAPSPFRLPVTGAIVGLLLLMFGFRVGRIPKQGLLLLFFWSGYATMCSISALINGDSILGEAWQLLGVPFLIFFGIPNYAGRAGIAIIALAVILGFSPYIVISLIETPLRFNYYDGIFGNSNTFGNILATCLAGLLCLLRGYLANGKRNLLNIPYKATLVLMIIATLVLIVASSSRTSLGTAAILMLLFVLSLFFDPLRYKLWIIAAMVVSILMLLTLMVASNILASGLFSDIIQKFDRGLLSGRDLIWETALKEASFFGHGNFYFRDRIGWVAHNNHIDVLGAKGIFALFFRICFDLFVITMALRLFIRNVRKDGYALGPLLLVSNYMLIGLSETVNGTLGHGIHMAFQLMIGMLVNYDQFHAGGPNENSLRIRQ
jgi:hypothetical protein